MPTAEAVQVTVTVPDVPVMVVALMMQVRPELGDIATDSVTVPPAGLPMLHVDMPEPPGKRVKPVGEQVSVSWA